MTRTGKRRGLNRPQKPVNFQISNAVINGVSSQPASCHELGKQILVLDLIIRRNKNQHRSQLFFKHARMLRNALKRLLVVRDQLEKSSVSQKTKSAEEVRRKFEQEVSLRGQKEVIEEHIREILIPVCYVSFSAVVADLPFANLGVVLMGLLAEVAAGKDGVGVPLPMADTEQQHSTSSTRKRNQVRGQGDSFETDGPSVIGLSTRVTGEDHGEIIERRYEHSYGEGQDPDQPKSRSATGSTDFERNIDMVKVPENGYIKQIKTDNCPATAKSLDIQDEKCDKLAVKEKRTKKKKNALDDLFSKLL